MVEIYLLFVLSAIISMCFYKNPKLAVKAGFGLSAISCFIAMSHFVCNMGVSDSFLLGGNFLYSPNFALNPLGNFFSFVVVFIGFASSIYGMSYANEYIKKANVAVFASLFSIFILSMLLVISANNVFCFIVLWELMTLVSSFLILVNDGKGTLKAVMIYLGIAQIGAFCITCGLLLLSYYANSTEFSDFANLNMPLGASIVVFILFLIGFGSKAGMWPFHVWLPLAHPAAPSNVSALMSGVMIKVALFTLVKFTLYLPLSPYFGLTILALGAASSLFGVLYALCQHDYKALLAYHSVENIGIILLGLGTGIYGLSVNNATLAAIGFLAGCYHIVNHAIFKGLLFLCAGSVLHATHTRDMDVLGGLAKKMPWTAAGMFIGIMGIAALPPVNGFVSEWFTYQGMLQGAMQDSVIARYSFSLGVVALALTGVLVGMHLKLYAVIFSGTPRDQKIWENAKESPLGMVIGMIILMAGCIGFGVGANVVVDYIMQGVNSIVPSSYIASSGSTSVTSPLGSYISTPLIAIVLTSTMILPFVILMVMKANKTKPRETDPWACGFKYNSRMQMTGGPFTGDLRKIMQWLFRADKKIISKDYFTPVEYHNHPKDIWWGLFYEPFINLSKKIADKIGIFQSGYTNVYSFYIILYLCLMLAVSYFLI
ncbi:hydrogenase-4, component B [Campylobacter pinnipediorum subsp. caledonicus]|uniref:Hydrogenase-4, component B n=1 Tax=Campylobacter pinnipediorum subsp. caledonicus TaxID=1874362 RepID=A0A1S6U696_9BACT|nr:proton-conducting transporter membrane subunit [Campylobacter pinnipediorum]AQW87209.1 hydrogenase-4, component B [Campylobacter pinnipediorum subsp. caledonicus]OPA71883.1 NADH dehydrogenase [Campylobacter pinnipediorum subsp. caledonicus]